MLVNFFRLGNLVRIGVDDAVIRHGLFQTPGDLVFMMVVVVLWNGNREPGTA